MRGKKHGAGIYWESHRWLLEVEKDGKKSKFCLKMGGKGCYFESVGYLSIELTSQQIIWKIGRVS